MTCLTHNKVNPLIAVDGPEALALVESPDGLLHLLVTDVVIPGMTGKEVAAALQASHCGLRVIYLSGYAEHLVVQRGVIEEECGREAVSAVLTAYWPPPLRRYQEAGQGGQVSAETVDLLPDAPVR